MQLISYLRNIKEYKIEYGYLVYWYYYTSQLVEANTTYVAFPQIHDVRTLKVVHDSSTEKFYQDTVANIRKLQTSKLQAFNPWEIPINKCVGCVVNKYCTHKSKRLNNFSYPYNREDLELFFASFPEELKKQKV